MAKEYNYNKKPNGKNDTGRPEKWTLEFVVAELEWMIDFLDKEESEYKALSQEEKRNIIPPTMFFKELCLKRNYSQEDFINSTKAHEKEDEFFKLYKKIKERLELRLVKFGLYSKKQSTFPIFLLKNHYGYRDVQEVERKGTDEISIVFKDETN